MFFRTAIVALLASFVSAEEKMIATEGEIPASSDMGQSLLMKATVVEEARILNNNNDYSWMASYSIRYTGCTSLVQVAGNNGGNNNNKNNDGNLIYTQHLVTFSLCPVDYCNSKCEGGGHYVVNMADFVDLYTEAKMAEQELACENVREACYCDDANDDDACEYACYAAANMADLCVQYDGQENFEVQRYLECAELENKNGGNNNNNNNNYNYGNGNYYYGSYYVGPYCPDGKNIYMGLFYDQGCSAKADVAEFATRMGSELPYASKSIVTEGECMSCLYTANENNNNDNGEVKINELCSTTWYSAAHCEENMAITYPDTTACDYIKNILPRLAAASMSMNSSSSSSSAKKNGKAAKAFAYIFAFTTVLFAAYAYFLYRKIKRGVVALSAQGN